MCECADMGKCADMQMCECADDGNVECADF
jgi:hypothetical protein